MNEELFSNLISIAILSLVAAVSPGADFCIVLRNSLRYSRTVGLYTALGIAMGLLVHLSYTLVGIAVLIKESVFLYNLIKYAGAAYLFYLGSRCIYSALKDSSSFKISEQKGVETISTKTAFKQGFLTNLLNPKATIFLVSLFSQFISVNTPLEHKIEYAIINLSITLAWFCFLAYMVTGETLLKLLNRFYHIVDLTLGCALILLSIRITY